MIAPDDITFEYVKGREFAPQGEDFERSIEQWRSISTDEGALFDEKIEINAEDLEPHVTWGTNPGMVLPITSEIPSPHGYDDPGEKESVARALEYMDLQPGIPIEEIALDKVFIGSCTNGRIEDLREAASVARGQQVADGIKLAMVVPGSGLVKAQAEAEGLDRVFLAAGFEWREPGCSMCLAMNADRLEPGERCAATSTRNFEGRQGQGGRTHLVSPAMAAAAAVNGHFVNTQSLDQ